MKITNKQLIDFCTPILQDKFGKETALARWDLSPEAKAKAKITQGPAVWSIVTIGKRFGQYTIHGAGKTPKDALEAANLRGLVEDAKEHYKKKCLVNYE